MPATFQDYYSTLGVPRDASDDAIKKAFRKLARRYHPDVATDKSTAEEKFKSINEAYEVLGDPVKRRKYDEIGAAGGRGAADFGGGPQPHRGGAGQEFHFGGTGFSDFFEQYFSGGTRYGFPDAGAAGMPHGHAGGSHPRRGNDIEGDILVTLAEAMHGTIRPITMQTINHQTGQKESREFQVRIPPGSTDGCRIRVPGHGEPARGGAAAGDLFLRVRHAMHPDFHSHGADIHHDLDIAPWEAVLGAEILVPTLDGPIKLRIPAGAENGQKLRVRGRGLPKGKGGKSGERGDFYVILEIRTPSMPGSEEQALWEKLRDISTFHPRKAPTP